MHVFILTRNGKVDKKIEQYLYLQTAPVEIHVIANNKYISKGFFKDKTYMQYEKENRMKAYEQAILICKDDEIFCVQDEDKLCADPRTFKLIPDNLENAKKFLEENKEYGAVSLVKYTNDPESCEKDTHIDIGFVVYKMECFKKLNFNIDLPDGQICYCEPITKQIRNLGYKFSYLNNKNIVTHYKGGF